MDPILDLQALNKFKDDAGSTAAPSKTERLVFPSMDLKDVHFNIPIYPPPQTIFPICVVPLFGPSLRPRGFILCTETTVTLLRRWDIWLATYLDDWLLLAQSDRRPGFTWRLPQNT